MKFIFNFNFKNSVVIKMINRNPINCEILNIQHYYNIELACLKKSKSKHLKPDLETWKMKLTNGIHMEKLFSTKSTNGEKLELREFVPKLLLKKSGGVLKKRIENIVNSSVFCELAIDLMKSECINLFANFSRKFTEEMVHN